MCEGRGAQRRECGSAMRDLMSVPAQQDEENV